MPADAPGTNTLDQLSVWGMALCLLALPLSFLIFDFITPDGSDPLHAWSIWLRSRLIEPWFVGGILLGALNVKISTGNPVVNQIITSAIGAIVVVIIARMIA